MLTEQTRTRSTPSRPTPEALTSAIRAVLPEIKERAQSTERNRRVPDENIAALRAAGLYKVVQPRLFLFGVSGPDGLLVRIGWPCHLMSGGQGPARPAPG